MELRQLRYFVAVVDEGGFTRAAHRLHLTQPGLSAQIRQLERELGQPLLDRTARRVKPTEIGAAVLADARAALAAAERITQTVDEFTGLLRGQVRVGLISGAAVEEFDVAPVLAAFHKDHPQVGISLTEDTSERMLAALMRGDLDIALIGLTDAELDPGIGIDVVLDTPLVAAIAAHDNDHGQVMPLTGLRDRPLVCLSSGTGLHGVLRRACTAAGFTPEIAFEAAAPHLLLRLAAHGLGIAVVPELTAKDAEAFGVRTLPIVQPELRGRLALVWRTDRPVAPAAKVLLGQMRIAFGSGCRRGYR
ncbi:LysR family transcriptional regulator [Nocardia brevicatena]|uniref:LysR family transcriptional regulator n=1 Tax=Nocardia brevicatena TaxID=37327 RepID=UPI00031AB55C|nr:LysR family transcriptional regulator [Nocardia brevicatena]